MSVHGIFVLFPCTGNSPEALNMEFVFGTWKNILEILMRFPKMRVHQKGIKTQRQMCISEKFRAARAENFQIK